MFFAYTEFFRSLLAGSIHHYNLSGNADVELWPVARGRAERGALSLSSPYLQGGNMLGKGSSVHFLHLGHDVFNCMSHEGHKRTMSSPIHRISEALNERGGQGDGDSLLR